jgi:hypothetical protein
MSASRFCNITWKQLGRFQRYNTCLETCLIFLLLKTKCTTVIILFLHLVGRCEKQEEELKNVFCFTDKMIIVRVSRFCNITWKQLGRFQRYNTCLDKCVHHNTYKICELVRVMNIVISITLNIEVFKTLVSSTLVLLLHTSVYSGRRL